VMRLEAVNSRRRYKNERGDWRRAYMDPVRLCKLHTLETQLYERPLRKLRIGH
jgi:hypothetical protein